MVSNVSHKPFIPPINRTIGIDTGNVPTTNQIDGGARGLVSSLKINGPLFMYRFLDGIDIKISKV